LGFKSISKVVPQTTQLMLMHGSRIDFKRMGKDETSLACKVNAEISDFTYETTNPNILYVLADDHITVMQLSLNKLEQQCEALGRVKL
jgi:hypothetical protein